MLRRSQPLSALFASLRPLRTAELAYRGAQADDRDFPKLCEARAMLNDAITMQML